MRGYCGIGVYRPKTGVNIGTLVRSARCFGADFVFTVGKRYVREASSTKHERHIPVLHFEDESTWRQAMPSNAQLVCVEITENAKRLRSYPHPERAVYLLGAEDTGIPQEVMAGCEVVQVDTEFCLNVATAGSIVLYDRNAKFAAGYRRGAA